MERQSYKGEGERENLPFVGSLLKRLNGQGWELLPCLLPVHRGPSIWDILHCFPKRISKELDQKWSSWDLIQCPYGTPVLQVLTLPAMPNASPESGSFRNLTDIHVHCISCFFFGLECQGLSIK